VLFTLNKAYEFGVEYKGRPPGRAIFEGLSAIVSNFGFDRAYRLAVRLAQMITLENIVLLSILIPNMHSHTVTESFRRLYDGVLQLTTSEEGNRLQKYMRVLKSPNPHFDTTRIAYEVTATGFVVGIDNIVTAEEMKSGLQLVTDGVLQLFGERCIILPTRTLTQIVRRILSEDIAQSGSAIYTAAYKSVRQEPTLLIQQIRAADPDNLLHGFCRFLKVLGLGDLEISRDPTANEYTAILQKSPVAEAMKGFGAPVDFIHAGVMAAVLEELEGKPMECKETMCLAQGDAHCEFQITSKE
jgi:predicted hydrocarbon binding protein